MSTVPAAPPAARPIPCHPRRPAVFEALKVIRERGFSQGHYEDDKGRVCFVGAFRVAVIGKPTLELGVEEDDFFGDQLLFEQVNEVAVRELIDLARLCCQHFESDSDDQDCFCFDCQVGKGHDPAETALSLVIEANDAMPSSKWLSMVERYAWEL